MTETGSPAPQEAITPPAAPPALGTPYPNPRGTESFIDDELAENAEEIRAQHRETSSAEHDRDKLERLLHLERIYLDKSERSPQDIIDILLGLTTDELTRLDAEKKYGRNFFGNLKRSFNELYSVTHTDGQHRTALNRGAMARDAFKRIGRAVFNRRNVTAVAAATAMTVLTGGMGSTTLLAAGGGVLGAMGAEVADVFKGESGTLGARKELFIAEQERWAQLKSLALSYQAEMDRGFPEGVNAHHELAPNERLTQGNHEALRILRQIIDIYYMQGESFYVKRILDAQNSLGLKEEQLTKSRNKWMAIGGIAGAAGGTAVDLLSGSFAPIDLDLQVNPQEWAHKVQRVGDNWTWVASAAEQAAGITGGNLANSTANIVAVNFAERGAAIVAAAYLAGGMADNDWIINSGNTRGFESNKAAILQNEEKRKDYFDHLRSQVQSNDEYFQKIADQFGVVVPENPVTDMPYDWVRQPQLIPKEKFNFSKVPTWLKRMVPDRTVGLDPAEFGSEMYMGDTQRGGFLEYAVAGVNKERNKIALVSITAQGDAEAYVVTVMDLDRFLTEYKPDIRVKGGDLNWPAAQGGGHENNPPFDPVDPTGTNPQNPERTGGDPSGTVPDPEPEPEPPGNPDRPRPPEGASNENASRNMTAKEKKQLIAAANSFDELIDTVRKIGNAAAETGGVEIAQEVIRSLEAVRDNKDQNINKITRDYGIRRAVARLRGVKPPDDNDIAKEFLDSYGAGESPPARAVEYGPQLTDKEVVEAQLLKNETDRHFYSREAKYKEDAELFYGLFAALNNQLHEGGLRVDGLEFRRNEDRKYAFARIYDGDRITTVSFNLGGDLLPKRVQYKEGGEKSVTPSVGRLIDFLRSCREKVAGAEADGGEGEPEPVIESSRKRSSKKERGVNPPADDDGQRKPLAGFRRQRDGGAEGADTDDQVDIVPVVPTLMQESEGRDRAKQPLTHKGLGGLRDLLDKKGVVVTDEPIADTVVQTAGEPTAGTDEQPEVAISDEDDVQQPEVEVAENGDADTETVGVGDSFVLRDSFKTDSSPEAVELKDYFLNEFFERIENDDDKERIFDLQFKLDSEKDGVAYISATSGGKQTEPVMIVPERLEEIAEKIK